MENKNDIESATQTNLTQAKRIDITLVERIYLKLKSIKKEIRYNNNYVISNTLMIVNILITLFILYKIF